MPPWLLPLAMLVILSFSLFVNPRERTRGWVVLVVIVAGSVVSVGQTCESARGDHRNREFADSINALRRQVRSLPESVVAVMVRFGYGREETERLRQSRNADQELKQLAGTSALETQREITVQYFAKEVDQQIVDSVLKALKFNVKVGAAPLPGLATNAIWFGEQVQPAQVKLVAYTLIRAGVRIRVIRPFRDPKGGRARLIQVGSDAAYAAAPPFTVQQILAARAFTR